MYEVKLTERKIIETKRKIGQVYTMQDEHAAALKIFHECLDMMDANAFMFEDDIGLRGDFFGSLAVVYQRSGRVCVCVCVCVSLSLCVYVSRVPDPTTQNTCFS